MKKILQTIILFFLFSLSLQPVFAQELTGIWRGYFITDAGDQYKYEVQIGQTKKAGLTGVTYSYLDTRFYGKATFSGLFTRGSKTALVQETKTVELKMAGGSVACIMKCRMEYVKSGTEEFLEGSYVSTYEKADLYNGIRRGGDCGGGKVYLRKVTTSDFYIEPFLRNKKMVTPLPTIPTKKLPVVRSNPKITTKPPVAKKTVPVKNPVVKTPVTNKPIAVDTVRRKPVDPVVITTKPVQKITPPVTVRDRKNELTRTIDVSNAEIEISLYDNGEVDDDTISVYLDGALILANKRLSNTPILYKLKLTEAAPEHTLIMVAENLGRIPPNTSLMIIQDGEKRYQVSITSTEQKNAMVRFRLGHKNE